MGKLAVLADFEVLKLKQQQKSSFSAQFLGSNQPADQ
jgi:hypothetical protein